VLIPNLNPSIIICDFEMAALKAFKNTFPAVEIQGCLFHLGQNIYKKIVEIGLKV
jgi:transposase-like protein